MPKPRLYALFERERGGRNWRRVSAFAYHKPRATVVFQDALLAPLMGECDRRMERSLRPVVPQAQYQIVKVERELKRLWG